MSAFRSKQGGLTITELLVGMLMTSILALAGLELMTANAKITMQETGHSAALSDAQQLFRVLSEFLKQAEICASCTPTKALDITYGSATNPNPANALTQVGDSIQIDFVLPDGYKIWPNDTAPYNQPVVRVAWANANGELTIAHAADTATLGAATAEKLIRVTQRSSRIINVDLWPLTSTGAHQGTANASPDGGYELCVAAKSPIQDPSFNNPDDSGDLYHYRTAKVCGVIFPRNW